jgi:hypothetical protein
LEPFEPHEEREVKRSATLVLAFATALSGSFAAYAQTDPATVHHHTRLHHHYYEPHHTVHHHFAAYAAPESTAAARRPGDVIESHQTDQMFKPYAQPGDGDADGLSSDPDDCMKGCIGGNPQ